MSALVDTPATAREGPPPAVVWAIAVQFLVVLTDAWALLRSLQFASGPLTVGRLGLLAIGIALLVGLERRSLVARRLVLIGAGYTVVTVVLGLLRLLVDPQPFVSAFGLPALALMLGFPVADALARGLQIHMLRRADARAHFGLTCPACGSDDVRGARLSLLSTALTCRACGVGWTGGRPAEE